MEKITSYDISINGVLFWSGPYTEDCENLQYVAHFFNGNYEIYYANEPDVSVLVSPEFDLFIKENFVHLYCPEHSRLLDLSHRCDICGKQIVYLF